MEEETDIWEAARKRDQPTYNKYGERTYELPSINKMYKITRQGSAVAIGKTKGELYSRFYAEDSKQRDEIEKELYKKLHGDPELTMDYNSIANYLTAHPDVVDDINTALDANLRAQGREVDEIQEALTELTEPWRVNYIYSLLTTDSPDYTTQYNISRDKVNAAIESETQVTIGGKRRRKNKNTKKYRKSRKSRKHRRTRKYRRARK